MPRHTQSKSWSPHKRGRIAKAYFKNESIRCIAAEEGVPYGSVHGIASRYTTQIKGQDLPRPGQPKKISDRDKDIYYELLMKTLSFKIESSSNGLAYVVELQL